MAIIPRVRFMWFGVCVCLLVPVTNGNIRYLRTVAFSAQRTQPVPPTSPEETIGSYRTMVRPNTNHFDSDSGVFTVPVWGIYALAFTFHQELSAIGSAAPVVLRLVRESADGTTKTDVVATEGPPAPAASRAISVPGASVLLELREGEHVYLVTSDAVDAGNDQPISFSGYLLTRL